MQLLFFKLLMCASIIGPVAIAAIIITCDYIIRKNARNKLFGNIEQLPYNEVGILLGTTKYQSFGPVNRYYKYRIEAALLLLRANKIKYIIVSGDNKKNNFNEPEQMKADLMREGISEDVILPDYAGYRTYDSMFRLKEIFNQQTATVISQEFHNQRAIYIASRLGINTVAFNARDLEGRIGYQTRLREKFARVKVFIDFIFNTGLQKKK